MGKVEVMSLYLPVVAMGSIPHIYQRAGLALGYPYSGCHVPWGILSVFHHSISGHAHGAVHAPGA